jgi:2-polyprenyl-3-methyl-5-hydroxy-6-metoxy-1,4-benzoquinol methylase
MAIARATAFPVTLLLLQEIGKEVGQEVDDDILDTQIRYYRARAAEYDEWFLRQGRYDHGAEHTAWWFSEVATVQAALHAQRPLGEVLELACGTGLWTERLFPAAAHVTAVDAAPETLALNRQRMAGRAVEYLEADLFSWRPTRRYDFIFFSFWLSHVPAEQFAGFWDTVVAAMAPGARVFFVDSLLDETSKASNHTPDRADRSVRKLNDGSSFEIVKVYHQPGDLQQRLGDIGLTGQVHATPTFFLHGCVGGSK